MVKKITKRQNAEAVKLAKEVFEANPNSSLITGHCAGGEVFYLGIKDKNKEVTTVITQDWPTYYATTLGLVKISVGYILRGLWVKFLNLWN